MPQVTIEQAMQVAIKHHQAGRLTQAEGIYRQVLAQHPNHADALNLLGALASQVGQHEAAAALLRQAVNANPQHAQAFSNLGNVLCDLRRFDEAVSACRCAIELSPGNAPAFNNLGHALSGLGKFDEAVAACRQAIQIEPGFAAAHHNLGCFLKSLGKLDEAIAAWRQAIRFNERYAEAYNNLGIALQDQGKFDEAAAAHRQAIALKPADPEAHTNLGNALRHQGKLREAIESHRRAIELGPGIPETHWNLSLVLLALGDFAPGWKEYEWRWKSKGFPTPLRNFGKPQWDGENLNGRTILLHAEQGLGDTIQFVRYAFEAIARGGTVILECQPALHRLLEGMPGVSQVLIAGQSLPAFDLHCPLMSLPLASGTRLETIPCSVPYLSANPQLAAAWAHLFADAAGKLKVGLAWAGNPDHQNDLIRSVELRRLAPLAAVAGVRYYSIQKGPAAQQTLAPDVPLKVFDLDDKLTDFAETAALIANLDLVITVDTAVAHLAGAMGKPVWVLLPFLPDWRWMLDREDSPWYPTMRLFRQKSIGNWDEVIARVTKCLVAFGSTDVD